MRIPQTYNSKGIIHAVVETPKYSNFKYDYDPELKVFLIKKSLPLGMHFPFNFGFIPQTLGEDGDPLDILILSQYPLVVGSVAMISLIGVLEAEQIEKGKALPERNDRFIGELISEDDDSSAMYESASELPKIFKEHTEAFFVQFAKLSGKTFTPLKWHGPNHAKSRLERGIDRAKADS